MYAACWHGSELIYMIDVLTSLLSKAGLHVISCQELLNLNYLFEINDVIKTHFTVQKPPPSTVQCLVFCLTFLPAKTLATIKKIVLVPEQHNIPLFFSL